MFDVDPDRAPTAGCGPYRVRVEFPAGSATHDRAAWSDGGSVERTVVLGPVSVRGAAGPVELGGFKQRVVIAVLIAAGGRVVSVARLTDELWGENPPAKARVSLQSYVANLRKALEPHRISRSPARVLVTRPPGYALVLPVGTVDALRFERLVASTGELLLTDPARARDRLSDALSLWQGEAYADVRGAPSLAAEALRLEEYAHRWQPVLPGRADASGCRGTGPGRRSGGVRA